MSMTAIPVITPPEGRHGVGPQIGGGDHIDQIGRAGKVCAGKGKATAGNRAGQQIAGQVGLLEQGEGNGIQLNTTTRVVTPP